MRSLHAQVKRLEAKIELEKLVLAKLPELSMRLLEIARERGRLTVLDAVTLTGANRNTVKWHLRKMVEAGQGRYVSGV